MGADAGEIGLLKKSMHGNAILATAHEKLDISAGIQLEESVSSWKHRVSGKTLGDDFVLTGPTDPLTEVKNKMTGVYPIKPKLISYGSTESIKSGESEELCISTIRDMSTCS